MFNLKVTILLYIVFGVVGINVGVETVSHYEYNNVVGKVIDFYHEAHPTKICSRHLGIRTNGFLWANYKNYNPATICNTTIRCQNPDEPSALVIELDEKPADGSVCGFLWPPIGGENVCVNEQCVDVTLVD